MPSFRLPDGWSAIEAVEDEVVADGVAIRRAGLAARAPSGEEIVGAAAEPDGSPAARARYELFERAALLDALADRSRPVPLRDERGDVVGETTVGALFPESPEPSRWRFARSNGVALHAGFRAAAERARFELVERDRVLRAWYGEVAPERLEAPVARFASAASYELTAHELPTRGARWDAGVRAVMVVAFPRSSSAPLCLGYGARATLADALAAAIAEATQQLAFLWGEAIPTARPEPAPHPAFHLEQLLWPAHHAALRAFLDGAHRAFRPGKVPFDDAPVTYADLTPSWLPDGLRVVRASCAAALPLAFGDAPFGSHLPAALRFPPVA